jgi:hypothetical protein
MAVPIRPKILRRDVVHAAPYQTSDWQHPAEQATSEMDSDKLMNHVTQLDHVLGERKEKSRARRHQENEGLSFSAAA